ncbi:hypothetical protein H5410_022708 [Solanum commersonii]|uniref:DUF7746 domain-containing protein n=1 Tax=Solanum commersonii TaxID=4109 RepID=A0A9J5ZET4_SOLCO|nr:hypothetical protein H5410_022708 [Solanum commersonii]
MSVMYFFMEFSIPWIMKWSVEVHNTSEGFPCLQRTVYTKFWSKLLQKSPEGKLHGQEIMDLINVTISKYHTTPTMVSHVIEESSPFTKIARKLQMKKGVISKSKAIAIYMEEVKKDLMKNLDIDIRDDISMISANDEEEDLETILKRYQQQLEESSSASTAGKGKEKMGTFEKLGLKQVVKTTEETITIDSDNQTFRLLYDNDLAPYKDIYRFMHIGLVQVAFKPLTLRGLPESFIAALRDGRNHNWKKSLIGTIQTSLAYGPVYFNAYPNLQISLQDNNSLSSLMLNVKLHGYDYMPGTEVVCICYKIYYKLLHTLNPMCKIIDFKNETILIETNFDKSKVVTRRPIKWEEIDFSQEWVIENAIQPQNNINFEVSEIEQLNDGTVKIRFHDPSNMLIDNRSMSSRISRSNSSYISPVDYIVQVPSRASTSQIRETYRCDNIKIDRDNIVKPIRRTSSDLDITELEINFLDRITDFTLSNREITRSVFPPQQSFQINKNDKIVDFNAFSKLLGNDTALVTVQHVKSKEKVTHSSLQPPPDIEDFKIKDYSDLESFLEKKFKGGGVQPLDTDNFIEGEPSITKTIADMIIAGFTGQLKGWWDNYLNQTQRDTVLMAVKQEGDQVTQNALIASSSSSGMDVNHPMYKEFMNFMKSKKKLDNNPPSYSSILINDENI